MNKRLRQQMKAIHVMNLKGVRPIGILRIYDPNLDPPSYRYRLLAFNNKEHYEKCKAECGDDLELL